MNRSNNKQLLGNTVILVMMTGIVAALASVLAQRMLFGKIRVAATLAVVICAVLGASGLGSLKQRKSD